MGLSLSGTMESFAQGLGNPSTTAKQTLGTEASDSAGNLYRYVAVGAQALVAGNWLQGPAQVALHQNLAPTADVAIGATSLTVTLGATAATANQYAGGWVLINAGPGAGLKYIVSSHPAANGSATLTLNLSQPIEVALTAAASKVDLQANPYNGVIQSPITTLTGVPVGVAVGASPANSFDWIQTRGVGAALIAGTPGVGLALVLPGTAAGAAVVDGATAPTPIVGRMLVTGVDGRIQAVYIALD